VGYIFVADSVGLSVVNLTQLTWETAVLCETHDVGHWAVQGYLRSLKVIDFLVPIESPYAASY